MAKRLLCNFGIHARAWRGTGMMGDGHRCVDCGFDTYFIFIGLHVKDLDEITDANRGLSDAQRWETAK